MGVDGQLGMVQAELLHAHLIHPAAQAQQRLAGQKAVAAGDDQVGILRQAVGQHADEIGDAAIRQQVEVVNEDVAGALAGQNMAQIVRQQTGTGGVGGAVVVPQQVEPRPGKGVLHALPEDGDVVGVDADADHLEGLRLGPLSQIPVDRRGLAVAHGRHHSGQCAAGNGPQALLQPLGYVDGIQMPFLLCHSAAPAIDCIFYPL